VIREEGADRGRGPKAPQACLAEPANAESRHLIATRRDADELVDPDANVVVQLVP
jgi:hypothetical protein